MLGEGENLIARGKVTIGGKPASVKKKQGGTKGKWGGKEESTSFSKKKHPSRKITTPLTLFDGGDPEPSKKEVGGGFLSNSPKPKRGVC